MDPAAMGPPPADPGASQMADQEMMRKMIQEEIQKAMGGQGEGAGVKKSGGNKMEAALAQITEKIDNNMKMTVAALRQGGIEVPLADMLGIERSENQQGSSELIQPSQSVGGFTNESSAKVASFEQDIEGLDKLLRARQKLGGIFAEKKAAFDVFPAKNYFAGLYR
jgi:hypothetical protein